jgi:recombination associated protein RdgC
MWFKNVRAYRLTQPFTLTAEQLSAQLESRPFMPCAPAQPVSMGFVPALGDAAEMLVHGAGGCLLLRMRREEKLLPATVVREQLEDRVADIEARQARRVYRKERMTLKDEVIQDCLPRAFTRTSYLYAYIDTARNWLFVDSASATRAEELLNLLRECIGSLPLLLPDTHQSPQSIMTQWLLHRTLPDDFQAAGECELREPGEEGGIVRCRGVDLFSDEVRAHLEAGLQVARLALGWDDRLRFVLGEDLCLRRLRFADELLKENDELADEQMLAKLDADFALMTAAISSLQERVVTVFGGAAA